MEKPRFGINYDVVMISLLVNILSLAVPIVLLQIYDRILPNEAFSTATLLFLGAIVALVLEAVLRFFRTYLLSLHVEEFEYVAAIQAWRKLFNSDIAAAMDLGSGALKQRLSDIARLREHYSGQTSLVLFDLPFSFLFLAAIWYINSTIVYIPLSLFTVAAICNLIAGRSLKSAFQSTSATEDDRMNYVTNILNTLSSVKSHGGEQLALRIFRDKSQKLIVERTRLDRLSNKVSDFVALLGSLTTIATVAFGALLVMDGQLTTGGLAACTILAGRSLGPIVSMMMLWTQLQRTRVAQERIEELWALPDDKVFDRQSQETMQDGSIVMNDVTVVRGKKRFVFNMSIPSGDKLKVVDESGGLIPLFLGLMIGSLKPESGEMLVGGLPVSFYSRNTYRQSVAFVPRRSQIFRGTILENLTLFEPAHEKRAIELSNLVGLTPFIHRLPNGFRTRIGDMIGGPLEIGAVQRIAIVRALINSPHILVLNEADEGIDINGKKLLADLIMKVEGITVLLLPTDSLLQDVDINLLPLHEVCTISTLTAEEDNRHEHHRKQDTAKQTETTGTTEAA